MPWKKYSAFFGQGFITGLGSAFGATVGFVVVTAGIIWVLKFLGGLPVVGDWIAAIVKVTEESLRYK